MKKRLIYVSGLVLFLDQLIKYMFVNFFDLNEYKFLINDFLYVTHTRNDGAAWSMLSGNRVFLIAVTLVALVLIYLYFIRGKKINNYQCITYSLLIGGILGNLWDRVFLGYVIDYIGLIFGNYYFPIFNLADSCIVISCILIIIESIKGDNNEVSSRK